MEPWGYLAPLRAWACAALFENLMEAAAEEALSERFAVTLGWRQNCSGR